MKVVLLSGTPPTPGSLRSDSFSPFGGSRGPWNTTTASGSNKESMHVDSGIANVLDDLSIDDQHLSTIAEREETAILAGPEGLRMFTNSADSSNSSGK